MAKWLRLSAALAYVGLQSFTLYSKFDLFLVVIAAAFVLGLIVRRWWATVIPFVPLVPVPLVLALSSNRPSLELSDMGLFVLAWGLSLTAAAAAGVAYGAAYALRARPS